MYRPFLNQRNVYPFRRDLFSRCIARKTVLGDVFRARDRHRVDVDRRVTRTGYTRRHPDERDSIESPGARARSRRNRYGSLSKVSTETKPFPPSNKSLRLNVERGGGGEGECKRCRCEIRRMYIYERAAGRAILRFLSQYLLAILFIATVINKRLVSKVPNRYLRLSIYRCKRYIHVYLR